MLSYYLQKKTDSSFRETESVLERELKERLVKFIPLITSKKLPYAQVIPLIPQRESENSLFLLGKKKNDTEFLLGV